MNDYVNPSTPPELCEQNEEAVNKLLPPKSTQYYTKSYDRFITWKKSKNAESFSQRVLLAYFNELSSKWKATTLWSEYSRLKTMVYHHHKIDINYPDLKRFLKRMGENAESDRKKAKTFTAEEIERFLTEAPDDSWLAIKVAAIFGFLGACRRAELRNITTADIEVYYSDTDREKKNPMIHINIPKTKTNKPRSFTLEDEYYKIYKKYDILRSQAAKGRKDFFLQYHNGKCSNQVIGVNTFGEMPKKVALFLGLDQPEKYTGHSWRRTSATLLVDGGADITMLKRHGGWRSDQVAEGYIESSRNEKRKIYNRLTSSINLKPPITSTLTSTSMSLTSASSALSPKSTTSLTLPPVSPTLATETTSTDLDSSTKENKPPTEIISPRGGLTLQISNCSNCTFQFVHKKEDDWNIS